MAVYVCDIIGTGTEFDPFRPAIAEYLTDWSAEDDREDPTQPTGTMKVVCYPTPEQHAAMIADPRIRYVGP